MCFTAPGVGVSWRGRLRPKKSWADVRRPSVSDLALCQQMIVMFKDVSNRSAARHQPRAKHHPSRARSVIRACPDSVHLDGNNCEDQSCSQLRERLRL